MIIAGIGKAGVEIATLFKPHTKNYNVLLFDEGNGLEKKDSVEEYDEQEIKIPSKSLKNQDEGILFVCGSGKAAGSTLRVLEALQGLQMSVFYIVPDLEFCSREERLRNKVHSNVLQEYSRSGKIKNLILASNKEMLKYVGAGSVTKYYSKVNYFIYSLMQNLQYCLHVQPEFGHLQEPKVISRISTIGMGSLEKNEEFLLFPLDNITETCYLYNINENDLEDDETILPTIQDNVRENKNKKRDTSYAIWKASDENLYYSMHYTHYLQNTED